MCFKFVLKWQDTIMKELMWEPMTVISREIERSKQKNPGTQLLPSDQNRNTLYHLILPQMLSFWCIFPGSSTGSKDMIYTKCYPGTEPVTTNKWHDSFNTSASFLRSIEERISFLQVQMLMIINGMEGHFFTTMLPLGVLYCYGYIIYIAYIIFH